MITGGIFFAIFKKAGNAANENETCISMIVLFNIKWVKFEKLYLAVSKKTDQMEDCGCTW